MRKLTLSSIAVVLGFISLVHAAGLDQNALLNNIRETQDLPASVVLQLGAFQPSGIPGFSVTDLTLTYQGGVPPQTRKIFVSDDNRHYVLDSFGDLTTNPDQDRIAKVNISQAPILGNSKAPVTVVQFTDFQCPFCLRAFEIQGRIMKDYGDKVRWVYKAMPLPFHPWAEPAAVMMGCAVEKSAKKSWAFYNDVFQHQNDINNARDPKASLLALAKESGFKSSKFLSCVENQAALGAVKKDSAEGQAVGINGTPGFMVNGHLVTGADEQALRLRIDECLQGKHGKYAN